MSTVLKPAILEKLKPISSVLLKVSIWTFIAGVILSVIMILAGDDNFGLLANYGRILGVVFLFACSILIAVNNFKRLESNKTIVSALGLTSLISNVLNFLFWALIIWGVFPIHETARLSYGYLTVFGKIACTITTIFIFSFIASNTLLIGEKSQSKNIKPLKITSLVCLAYGSLSYIISTLANGLDFKLLLLTYFASFIWVVSSVLAVVISISSGSSEKTPTPKSDAELRAEIEAKVRAEMIEKEVRANIAAEQNQTLAPVPDPTPAPVPESAPIQPAPIPESTPIQPAPVSESAPILTPDPAPVPTLDPDLIINPTPIEQTPPIEQPPVPQAPAQPLPPSPPVV